MVYVLCTFVDFQLFAEKNWKLLLGGSVVFILLLLTPLGNDHNSGNLNWLDIPHFPVEIQPNEIDKIPFILLLALLIHKIQADGRDIGSVLSVFQIGAYAAFIYTYIYSPWCAGTWACAWCTPSSSPSWPGAPG